MKTSRTEVEASDSAPMPIERVPGTHAKAMHVMASRYVAIFGLSAFDQVALPSVSAGVEATGRTRYAGRKRLRRTSESSQLLMYGSDADRAAESERLRTLHREVRGVGYNGIRYSALNPESWNWVLISGFNIVRHAYEHLYGESLTAEIDEDLWDLFRWHQRDLLLPTKSGAVPDTCKELDEYIDRLAQTALAPSPTLDLIRDIGKIRPANLPRWAHPAYAVVTWPVSRVIKICSLGIMHPQVRELTGFRWESHHSREMRAYTAIARVAFRCTPRRLHYHPLAYNRWKADRLDAEYRQITARMKQNALPSFLPDRDVPPIPGTRCPIG